MRPTGDLLRRARRFAFWALAGVSLLLAHDAVILAQTGPGAELSRVLRTGAHDYWGPASALLALAGLVVALAAGLRLFRLRRTATRLNASRVTRPRRTVARIPGLWLRLFAIVAVGFAIQENVEHLVGHAHLLGAGALLGPEYPLALPVIALVTLLTATIAAALVSVERDLLTAIATALAGIPRRAPRSLRRPPAGAALPRLSLLARPGAGRGPPALLVPMS